MICQACPRACKVPREQGAKGYCQMPLAPTVARAALHFGEEPCLSGTKGSGTVFFSGCNLKCVFCQNEAISHGGYGKTIRVERLREIYGELAAQGAHNLNLVNPSHYVDGIVDSLSPKPPIPVVYNSSGYDSVDSLRKLEGLVDVYLPDMKYAFSSLAQRYSDAPDYPSIAKAAIDEMLRQQPKPVFNKEGMLLRGVMIRHLILPNQPENTFEVIDWVNHHFPKGSVLFSLMAQYTPCGDLSAFPELQRPLTEEEYRRAVDYLTYSGIENGFYQELSSSDPSQIPDFSLQGVCKAQPSS